MADKVAKLVTIILKLDELKPWEGNPREDLQPGDPDYENIKASIAEYDYLEPIVWNKRSNQIVGGHQRLKVLKELGYTHAEVRVVDFDEQKEIGANLMLNKAVGRWDAKKLPVALSLLDAEHQKLSGFSQQEIKMLGVNIRPIGERPPRTMRPRLNWKDFKIFHAGVDHTIYIIDGLCYLTPFYFLENKEAYYQKGRSKLFLDSGLLGSAPKEGIKALENQGRAIETGKSCGADYVSALDIPMIREVLEPLHLTKDKAMAIHLDHVQEFSQESVPFTKVYVVQGFELDDYAYCAEQMRPYINKEDMIAIGSIKNRAGNVPLIVKITELVKSYFPENELHLFGITHPATVAACAAVGATSCDSSTANMSMTRFSMLYPAIENGHCVVRYDDLREKTGIPDATVGGAMRLGLLAFNMGSVEMAIRTEMQQIGETNEPDNNQTG
jgi:hypothetical protein